MHTPPVSALTMRSARVLGMAIIAALVSTLAQPLAGRAAGAEQKLLYVSLNEKVAVYDIARNHAFVRYIPVPGATNARSIQACARMATLYLSYTFFANRTYGGLVAVDLRNDRELWRKQFEKEVDAFSLTPDCKKIYASTGESSVKTYDWVVDAADGDILTTIPVSPVGGSHNAVVGPSGKYAYLSSLKYEYLTVADTATDTVERKLGPLGGAIRPFVVNGRETLAFVNVNYLQGFEVLDLRSGKVLHRVKLAPQIARPNSPNPVHGVGLTADEKELWQTGADSNVFVFDATVMPPKQIAKIPVRELPKWISMSIDNRYVYPGTGEVIDRLQRKVVASIAKSKRQIEVDFVDGVPVRAADMYALGYVGAPPRPDEGSLIRNGSFEQDADADGDPDDWSSATLANRSAAEAHSGSYSLRHQASGNRDYTVWQTVSGLQAGRSYTLDGWVNIPPTSDTFALTLELAWRRGDGSVIRTDPIKTWSAATGGWELGSATHVAPSGTSTAVVRMSVSSLAATVYVDDIRMR